MQEKDVRMDILVADQRPYCVPESMDAEDNLFILYTSGSTGMPKGIVHTTGGYALYAAHTTKTTFDLAPGDIFACVADCGWITGHSYVVYGPLLNGCTTFMFESTPVYPDEGRYWDMIQRHKITQFYTSPTAIRLLMRYGEDPVTKYDLSSLKVLGTVGEPINPEAWRWYYENVGKSECTVVDTYWQTETGGHLITNLPGVTPMKPGSCTLPFFGIDAVVLDPADGHVVEPDENGCVEGVMALRQPWPGMARTCLGDHARYMTVYLKPYKGYYFTGDSVRRDEDGNHFIIGRVDDIINVSGHRIGTAEVESALVAHPAVAQAAVVGQPHDIKGQSICAFCMLTNGFDETPELVAELRMSVRTEVGAFCMPDLIVVTPSLPMTRSGKIMRRILRKIVCGEIDSLGDTSTLADPSIVDTLINKVESLKEAALV
jgi:acetyl-CoA synthetase